MQPIRFRSLWACVLLLLAAAALPGRAGAQAVYESIAWPGKCMDNSRGDLSDGNPLIVYTCQFSVNQYFLRQSDGHVVVQKGQAGPRGYPMCMDYYPTAGRVGDPVRIWPCRPLTGPADSQHWYQLSNGQWLGGSGNCVGAPSGTNAAALVMVACNPSNPPANSRWKPRI